MHYHFGVGVIPDEETSKVIYSSPSLNQKRAPEIESSNAGSFLGPQPDIYVKITENTF